MNNLDEFRIEQPSLVQALDKYREMEKVLEEEYDSLRDTIIQSSNEWQGAASETLISEMEYFLNEGDYNSAYENVRTLRMCMEDALEQVNALLAISEEFPKQLQSSTYIEPMRPAMGDNTVRNGGVVYLDYGKARLIPDLCEQVYEAAEYLGNVLKQHMESCNGIMDGIPAYISRVDKAVKKVKRMENYKFSFQKYVQGVMALENDVAVRLAGMKGESKSSLNDDKVTREMPEDAENVRKYVGGLNGKVFGEAFIGSGDITRRLYPGLKVPTISELEIQQKIRQIATTVLRNPQIIGVLNRETKRLFIKTFERLYNEAEQIVEPFVLKLEEIKYDCTAVIEDLKVYLYSKMEMLKKYSLKDYEVEQTISSEEYEMIEEVFQEYGVPEDFTVDKVIVLNQPAGASYAGHTAVMLIGEDGSGLFYSYRGNFEEEGISIALGQDAEDELETLYLTSERVEEFFVGETSGYVYEDYEYYSNIDKLDSDKIEEWEKMLYTRGTMIDIDNEQGMNMIIEAENIRMDEERGYNLYTNNCGQNASRIVAAGNEKYGATTGDGLNTRLMKVFLIIKCLKLLEM